MIRFLLILLLLPVSAWAQLKATGPSTWTDTVSGRNYNNMGPGGRPTLCYQKADGEWDFIVDDWVQVGQRQVWKSVRGNHRVFVDSAGNAIYAKGNHYLGTKTTHLIKFNKSDSTWQLLKASLPDSLTMQGRTVTFHGIYPGVDLVITNNPKVFRELSHMFVFHQEARDSLATWGPWAGYLLGTATRLNVDSLNLSWKDALGLFDIDIGGRTTNGWVKAMDSDTMVFTIASSVLHSVDSATTIKVHKRLVIYNGTPYLVEMFNPVLAAGLPEGDVWHNAVFGNQAIESYYTSIEDNIMLQMYGRPGESGDLDSCTCYLWNSGDAPSPAMMGIYIRDPGFTHVFVDSTNEITMSTVGWYSAEFQLGASISDTAYLYGPWAEDHQWENRVYRSNDDGSTADIKEKSVTYGDGWLETYSSYGTETADDDLSCYITYSTGAPAAGNIIPLLDKRPIRGVGRGIGR